MKKTVGRGHWLSVNEENQTCPGMGGGSHGKDKPGLPPACYCVIKSNLFLTLIRLAK